MEYLEILWVSMRIASSYIRERNEGSPSLGPPQRESPVSDMLTRGRHRNPTDAGAGGLHPGPSLVKTTQA